MSHSSKVCYIDVETTGLSPKFHSIDQISGLIEIDGKVEKNFNILFRPFHGAKIEKSALELRNITQEELTGRKMTFSEGYKLFESILTSYIDVYNSKDKMLFVGYNCHKFDWPHLYAFFNTNKNKYFGSYFWKPSIDVMLLASWVFKDFRSQVNVFKLMNIAQTLSIKTNEKMLHDSEYDIYLTREIYLRLNELCQVKGDLIKERLREVILK